MSLRYRYWDEGEEWCTECGVITCSGAPALHDAFHDRLDRLVTDLVTPPKRHYTDCAAERGEDCNCRPATLTSLSGPAAVRTSQPEPPTSVAPAGEDYGAPTEPPDESVAVFLDSDGDLIPMKRFDDYWYGRDPDDKALWRECIAQLGTPIAVHVRPAVPGGER